MRNFLLLVMMLVTTVANAANLLSKQYIGSVYYNFYDDGHAEATYGTLQSPENYSGDIQIRSKVQLNGKDYTVTAIGEDAFYACSKLTSVNIPTTVKSIGATAFYGCTGLTEIEIPNSVDSIATKAFYKCSGLEFALLSSNLTRIEDYVFSQCRLNSIEIPKSVTYIGNYSFSDNLITSLIIPDAVEEIGSGAFYYNQKLQSLKLGDGLKYIRQYAFYGHVDLRSVEFGKSLEYIGEYAFGGYNVSPSIYGNNNLKTIVIPNSVKTIEKSAFANCFGLESVTFSNQISVIPERMFAGCFSLPSISIPNNIISIGRDAFSGCTSLGSISIPNSVTSINSEAFNNCSQCVVYLCNDHISKSHTAFSSVKKVVSCDNVQMPVEINYAFFYTGEEQTYNIPSTSSYYVIGNKRTEEGTQKVTVKLYDGFVWTNGTSDDIVFDFTIYPAKFTPEQTLINAYLGQKLKDLKLPKGCKWMDSPETVLEYTGENKFSVYYTPDGWTKAPLIIEMTVMVAKIAVELPLQDTTVYEYDGKSHTYQFKETEFYKVSNPTALTQTNAGTYNITVSLKNKAKYMWTSGSSNDLTYKFVIKKQTVTRPEADKTEFVYTGKELTYKLAENPLYTISNNVQTNIGSYSVLVSLKDQSNYMWDNGSSSNQTYSFIINKNGVKIPEADTRMFMYTGEPQTYYIPENELYTIKNNVQTNVGNYTVTVSLKNKDYYRWSDGSSNDKTYKFNIEKLKVVIPPTYNGSFTYNGKAQTYPIASDNAFVTVIGYDGYTGKYGSDSTQTNAGSYNVILSLKDKTNSMWVSKLTDTYGNSGNQIYTFVINPAEVTSYPAGLDPKELKLETTYGKTLSNITLPSEYKWVTPTTSVGNVGVKTFAANYTPKDSKNYLTTRVNLTVDVKPQPVAEPREDQTLFFYLAKPQKYGIETTDLYTVKNNVQTNVGTYDVVVSLRDKINYVWKTSASSSDLTYKFTISKSNEGVFEAGYNPNEINPKVQYGQKLGEVMLPTRFSWKYPETVATKIGDNKYTVIYTPSDPKNYNSVEVEIVVNVTKRRVAFPEKDSRLFVYNGKAQTYEVGNNSLYKVSNNIQTNAGRYDVKVALIDKDHYEWQDGTIDDIYQDFIIRTKSIEMPSIDSKSFVYDGKSHSLTIPASSYYTVSGNKGVDAGRYEVTLALTDKKNYVWENNTTADIVATFSISKIKVEIPAADNTSFAYTGEPHTYKIAASDLYTVTGNVQTKAGNYDVQVSLKDPKNYEWVDGSSNSLIYNFYIKDIVNQSTLEIVNIPSISKRTFVYDGTSHVLAISDTEKFTVSDEGGIAVGRYSATLSLTDKSKFIWENGSSDDVTIAYVVTKAPVAIPEKDARSFTYNTRNQTYTVAKNSNYTVKNNVQKNAGRYEVVVSLVDPKNYEWADGSSDDITMIFKIGKAKVSVPDADATKFTYTGKPQTYTIAKSSMYTVSNNVQTNAGTYDVIVSLADANNYMWSDGTTNDLSYNFVIRAEQTNVTVVQIPTVTTRSFVYNGKTQTLDIPESEHYIITNNKRVNAGRYVATVALRDPKNSVWSDGTKEDVQYVFNITKAIVDIPEIDHTRFVYTGEAQTYTIPSSEYYTVSGNVQTKVGQYEVVVALDDVKNYMWSDGTVDDLAYNFVIRAEEVEKKEIEIPAIVERKFIYNGKVQTLDIAQNEYYNVFNNKGVDVGRYTVTLSLVDPEMTVWENGSSDDVLLTFTISKAQVDFPTPDNTQFYYNGDYQTYEIVESPLYVVDNNEQKEAGRYEVNVALKDPRNYEWEDGTFEDLSYSFLISKAQVDEPKADPTKYVYNGKAQSYKIASSPLYATYGTSQTLPGKYEVLVALNDVRNYEWSNGTTDDLIYNFVIRSVENNKRAVEIPSVVTKNFIYDGSTKSLNIASSKDYNVTGNSGVDAGRYTVTLSLTDPKATSWSDGTTDDVKMTFIIAKEQVKVPNSSDSTYFYNEEYQTYEIEHDTLSTLSNNVQKNAGKYVVRLSLVDPKNYEWADGTIEDVVYNFTINKEQVAIPSADNSKFIYNGNKQTYKIAADSRYSVDGATQMMPGKYQVLVSLNDANNYEWSNGTSDVLSYNFVIRAEEINKTAVEIPTVLAKKFVYDGSIKYLDIPYSDDYYVVGDTGVNVGRYVSSIVLRDPTKTVWSDGSTDDIYFVFSITKAQVEKPSADNSKFVYDGSDKYYSLYHNAYDFHVYTVYDTIQKNAGRYDVTVSLNDAKNYEWSDGSVDDLNYNFTINKAQVEIPAVDATKFIYNGSEQTYKIAANSSYTVEGNKKTMPGKYEVLVSLVDPKNTEWSNGTTDALSYNFVIRAEETELKSVTIPSVVAKNFIYDGSVKSLNIASSKDYNVTGNKGVDAGRYTVTLSLTDPIKTVWSDGSTDDVKVVMTIEKAQVEKPSADNSKFVYDGTDKYYSLYHNAYDFHVYTVYDTIQKNAGRYDVTVSLNDAKNYEWTDGSVDDLNFNFVINKAQVEIPAVDATKFIYNGSEQTYKIAANSRYTVEGNKKTMPGKYEVLVSLVDPKNTEWSNGTTDALSYNFVIRAEETELKSITIPSVVAKNFIYDGSVKSLNIASSKDYNVTGNKGVDAGRYTVTLSLTDPIKTVWSDGSTDDVKVVMTIEKAQVEKPSADATKFIYNGKNQVYTLRDSSIYTISNNIQKNAGRYDVTVSLNDAKNYEWSDGSVDDLNFNFTINKAQVTIPAVDATKFIYNGNEQTYKIAANSRYTVEGNKKTMPGKYEVLVSLVDPKNTEWSNGTTEALSYNFVIRAEETELKSIAIPSVVAKNFIYDGSVKSLNIASSKDYNVTGNKGIDAGRYTVTLSLTDPIKTVWSDGSTDDVKVVMTIEKAQVEKPSADATKFTYSGKNQVYTLRDSSIYTISNNIQKNAGRYDVTVSLNDAKNYEWSDGSVDDLNFNFVINKAQVEIPAVDATKFIYNGNEQTYKIAANSRYTVEGNKKTMPGKYEVLVSLVDPKNTEWSNGTTDALSYNFVIRAEETELKSIAIPSVVAKNFIYDGSVKSLNIASSKDYNVTGNKGVDAGRYTVTLSLTDPIKTVWSDGSIDDVKMSFTIDKARVEKPSADATKFTYNTEYQTYSLRDSSIYTISNNVQREAGRYDVSVSLNDAKNYEWSDGSVDDLSYNFVINKEQVTIPAVDATKFIYNGNEQTYKIAANSRYTVEGNRKTMPGKYEVLVSLVDPKNTEWSNGTTEALSYNFVIRAEETELKSISIPSVVAKNFIYDGSVKSLNIASSKDYNVTGNKGVDAGRYTVTLSLTDPIKTVWSDGSIDDVKMSFSIDKAQVEKPSADATKFTYNGKNQVYTLRDSSIYTISNNIQKNAGRYDVTVSLNDAKNYEWEDGSVDDLNFNFIINKAQVEIPAVDATKFIYNGNEQTYKIAANSRYTVEGNKKTMPGKYEVLVSLIDPKNTEWSNGTTDALSYNFVIRAEETELKSIAIPSVVAKNFVYDGSVKSLNIASSKDYNVTGNKGVDAGRYTVTLSLTDPIKTVWSDGSIDDVKMSFTIDKAQVEKPSADATKFTYNTEYQTYSLRDSSIYTISNNVQREAGRYDVSVSLNDAKNYEWSDGSVDDLNFNFVINKAQVEIPAADTRSYVYNRRMQIYKLMGDTLYTISGNARTNAGSYIVNVQLNDTKNYMWTDGTVDIQYYNFVINKAQVVIPSADNTVYVFDGMQKTYKIAENTLYKITGNKQTMPGKYEVHVALTDIINYEWNDGTTSELTYNFVIRYNEIIKKSIEIPNVLDRVFVYDGTTKSLDIAKTAYFTITGNEAVNAGRYTVRLSLNDPDQTVWSDGSTEDIMMSFQIVKAKVAIPSNNDSTFVYNGMNQTYEVAYDSLYSVRGNVKKNAGRYEVRVALNDERNYEWTDGSSDEISMNFVINKAQVEIPASDTSKFVYTGNPLTYNLKADTCYSIDGDVHTMPGKYEVLVSLNDVKNTEWNNGTIDNLIYNFTIRAEEINKKSVEIPSVLTKNFIYDGSVKSIAIASNSDYNVTGNRGVEVGRYSVRLSLTDSEKSVWSDGSTDDIIMTFQIAKAQVEIPAMDTTKFVYTSGYQTYNVVASDLYSVTGNRQINVGNHDVVISLNDTKNYEWNDGTVSDIVYNFLIVKKEIDITTVDIPVVENTNFIYNALAHTLDVPANDNYTVVGNTKTSAGKYVVTVSLKDKSTMVWEDGSTDDLKIPFTISKATVKIPNADNTVFEYTGDAHTYNIPASNYYRISGNVQSLVGRHYVTVALVDYSNYMWADGTSKDLQYEFIIKLKEVKITPVDIPFVDKSNFIYNGQVQTLDVKQSPYYTISGNSQMLAGYYRATVSLIDKEHTSWMDGTTADIEIPFTIAKALVAIPSTDSSRFVYSGDTLVCPVVANTNYVVTGNKNVMSGNYQAKVALIDKANTIWEDGSSDDILIPYSISKIILDKPVSDSTAFVYNGDTMVVNIPANEWYNITNNSGVKAGKYAANIALVDKTNTIWNDGTTDDVVIPFTIAKSQVEIPAVDTTMFIYTGDTLMYTVVENEYYSVKGNVQSKVGRYSVVVSLNDIENYCWSDGSTIDLVYPFVVNEREVVMTTVARPVADTTMLVYNGEMQTFNIAIDSNSVVDGNVRMSAGKYLATVSLADRMTMVWEDGTTDDIIIPFTIAKAQVEIPAVDSTVFEFNGEAQTYNIPEDSLYTIEGNVQTNVGRYDIFVSLVDIRNYEWSDGTTDDLTYRFSIIHPIVKDTINPSDIKLPNEEIESGDTVSLYDKPGDYIFDMTFDSLAHEQGFEDVKGELGEDGINLIIPEDVKPGNYDVTVTITDIDGDVIDTTIRFSVAYPSGLIVRLLNDVLSVNNAGNEFTSYQWYKNDKKIDGATDQFYCDLEGVKGVYKVQVVNRTGDTLFIAEREFEAIIPPFNVTLSKNPVNTGESFTVTIEGIADSNILDSSSLVVYDINGVVVINKVGVEKMNTMSIGNIGEYIVVVRIASGQTVSKHLLVK